MRRGFTLVELLAVITILAIIALIAIPKIINIINDSKETTRKQSVELYGRSVENAVAAYFVNHAEENGVTFEELEKEKIIDYKGSKVECENIYIIEREVYMNDCTVNGKKTDATYGSKVKNMLIDESKKEVPENIEEEVNNYTFLNTGVKSKFIKEFYIHNEGITVPEGYQSIDCSYNQDESVICYWKEYDNDAGYYEMNLAADGEIYTPFNSDFLFFALGYEKLENLNLTGINTKYSGSMYGMFNRTGYTSMKNINLGDTFDTSSVTNMEAMFNGAGFTLMTELNLGNKFDTSNVTNMKGMFYRTGNTSMTTLKLGNNFSTKNVKDMSYMFQITGYMAMTELNLGNKFDTSNVTDMGNMFSYTGYTAMTKLNLGDKFDTTNVTNMTGMFSYTGYTAMTELNLGTKFDTSNVTNMMGMFGLTGYEAMTTLNLGDKFNTKNVTNMQQMFQETGKTSMTTLNLGSEFIIPNGTNTQYMFWGCGTSGKLTSVIVPTQALKTKILGLGNSNVPSWWDTNNIVTVQSN